MGRFSILLSFLLVSPRSFALDCPLPENASSYICEGVYVAKDMKTLKKYLSSNYGSSEGKAKDLKITFDLSDKSSIKIATPCSLFISSKKKVDPDKLCLNARDGIEFSKEAKIQTPQVDFNSPNFVKLSYGTKVDSTNFRIDATKIIVANDVKFDSDKVILNAKDKLIVREAKIKVSTFEANAADCVIDPDLKIKGKKKGNCFDNSHPKLKVKYSSFEGEAPFTFQVDTSKSTDDVGITHFVYSWGDGNSDFWTSSYASHIYTTPGKYLVTVRAYDALGLYDERRHSVNVLPSSVVSSLAPYADLKFSQYPSGLDISFSLLAWDQDGEVTSAKISYGDGLSETISNPLYNHALYHRYETAGSYEVTLTVTDTQGLSSSNKYTVNAGTEFVPTVSVLELFRPAPLKVLADFHKSFSPLWYQNEGMISWGDGATTAITSERVLFHDYAQEGTYTVSLTLINVKGIPSTVEKQITVKNTQGEKIYPVPYLELMKKDYFSSVRFYSEHSFDPDGVISKIHIDFGDGEMGDFPWLPNGLWIGHAYETGSYIASLTLTDNDGLSSTIKTKVDISELDGFKIRGGCGIQNQEQKLAGCGIEGVSNGSNISKVDFDWADGTIDSPTFYPDNYVEVGTQHTYASAGIYNVKIKAANDEGSNSSLEQALYVGMNAPPVPQVSCFLYYGAVNCNGYLSYDPDGYIGTYEWTWDDGMVEYGPSPQPHYFTEAGTHLIKLKVTDNLGLSSEASTTIQIIPNKAPIIDSFACNVVEGLKVHCDLSARDEDGSITSVQYGWGPEWTTNPDYEYAKKGQYNIAVYVNDDQGSSVSANTTLTVGPPNNAPVIDSFACTSDENLNAHCDLQAHDPDGDPLSVQYGWGPEWTVTPDYQYTDGGNRSIAVLVTDDSGGSAQEAFNIDIPFPKLAPVSQPFCYIKSGLTIHCDSSFSYDPDGLIITRLWDLGNGVTTSDIEFDYKLPSLGVYSISLVVGDNEGYSSSQTINLQVLDIVVPPNSSPVAQSECFYSSPYTLTCSCLDSTDKDGNIASCYWKSEEMRKIGSEVTFKYQTTGLKKVVLTVKDDLNLSSTAEDYVEVFSTTPPKALVNCSVDGTVLTCDGSQSSDSSTGKIVSYIWDVRGQDIVSGKTAQVNLKRFGEFTVVLEVMNNEGVIGVDKIKVTANPVYVSPAPEFKWDMNLNKEVVFDASRSLSLNRKVVSYEWSLGDGTTMTATSPVVSYSYASLGDMDVILTVTDETGVTKTATDTVYVHDPKVSNPGEENDKTLLGIDKDNDGIRDDVERWIVRVSKDNSDEEKALNDIALTLQGTLTRLEDIEHLKEVNLLLEKRRQCLNYLLPLQVSEATYKMALFQMFKTKQRYVAWQTIESNGDLTTKIQTLNNEIKHSKEDACE